MSVQPPTEPSSEDRRRAERRPWHGTLNVSLPAQQFSAQTENLSGVGVLLFSGSEVRVQVELEQPDGQIRRVDGRLVRYNRLSASKSGLAIEFDQHEHALPNDPQSW
jgi:hypothetical protein